jgi:Flp pilus assembly protein TadG
MQKLPGRRAERGQILPLFAIVLLVLLAMGALLFDGALALVLRRNLQNAGDAAALAAANVIQTGSIRGCSATEGPPPGTARAAVRQAAVDSMAINRPGFPAADITVTCPDGWENTAVKVELRQDAQTLFSRLVSSSGLTVRTTSTAINGLLTEVKPSVVLLDPGNQSWPNGRRGCPSVLLSGGPTVILESSMYVDSACTQANGGAFATNGNAASLTLNNGALIRIVGGYNPASLTVTPAPLTGQPVEPDPLAPILPPVPVSSLPVRQNVKLILIGGTTVLQPGVYRGGIDLRSSAKVLLQPGIYVMDGGGFQMGAQSAVYAIAQGVTNTSDATWATDCPVSTCGVMIYNTGGNVLGQSLMEQVLVNAGATLKLRAYEPTVDPNPGSYSDYRNILLWQNATPVPTSTYAQPTVRLNGGGNVDIAGTIYAPSAHVEMGGGSGGQGGTVDLTLQFIAWDLTISGNATFTFRYLEAEFVKPTDYGLIE